MSEINGVTLPFVPVGGISDLRRSSPNIPITEPKTSFKDVFAQELEKLKFSAHAQSRLNSRDLQLDAADMQRLSAAADKAGEKGGKDALVMLRDMAFIVNIPNKTVVTAVQLQEAESMVFTNIDSAVYA